MMKGQYLTPTPPPSSRGMTRRCHTVNDIAHDSLFYFNSIIISVGVGLVSAKGVLVTLYVYIVFC